MKMEFKSQSMKPNKMEPSHQFYYWKTFALVLLELTVLGPYYCVMGYHAEEEKVCEYQEEVFD
jgi:hypothetical protein